MDFSNGYQKGYANDAVEMQREPEVIAQLKRLQMTLDMQEQALARMANRLESVSSSRPPTGGDTPQVKGPNAPLAARIAELCMRANSIAVLINSMTDALEI